MGLNGELDSVREKGVKQLIKDSFYGYSEKRVSNHQEFVQFPPVFILSSYKSFLGIKYGRVYQKVERTLKFSKILDYTYGHTNIWHGYINWYYKIHVAIDEESRTIYWKYALVDYNSLR